MGRIILENVQGSSLPPGALRLIKPGLQAFLGLPWQYTWGSGRFSGVAADAQFLAQAIAARHAVDTPDRAKSLNELALGS